MKKLANLACLVFVGILHAWTTGPVSCQESSSPNTLTAANPANPPAATINDVAWIAGNWHGKAMDGQFQETWNPPVDGSMMGMFRFSKGGKVGFYELLTITPAGESLILRLKHFSSELHGWEEKDETVDFALVKLTDTEAFFDGLTFRKAGPDEIHIFVVVDQKDGNSEEIQFVGRRVGHRP